MKLNMIQLQNGNLATCKNIVQLGRHCYIETGTETEPGRHPYNPRNSEV